MANLNNLSVNVSSEIGELEAVITHTPGSEVENMTPENAERALYSDILNLAVAQDEYKEIQDNMEISAVRLRKVLNKLSTWKAAGPDGLQGYWVKNFTSLHSRIVYQLKDVMNSGAPP